MAQLSEEQKNEIQQIIRETLVCGGTCGWTSEEWREQLDKELNDMVQTHIVQLKQDMIAEVLPKFATQVTDGQARVIEHFNDAMRESRTAFSETIDKAVERIRNNEQDCAERTEQIAIAQIHHIVNGKFDRILTKLDELEMWKNGQGDRDNSIIDKVAQELRGRAVPAYVKFLFSNHPIRFTITVAIASIITVALILRIFDVPAVAVEQAFLSVFKHLM